MTIMKLSAKQRNRGAPQNKNERYPISKDFTDGEKRRGNKKNTAGRDRGIKAKSRHNREHILRSKRQLIERRTEMTDRKTSARRGEKKAIIKKLKRQAANEENVSVENTLLPK